MWQSLTPTGLVFLAHGTLLFCDLVFSAPNSVLNYTIPQLPSHIGKTVWPSSGEQDVNGRFLEKKDSLPNIKVPCRPLTLGVITNWGPICCTLKFISMFPRSPCYPWLLPDHNPVRQGHSWETGDSDGWLWPRALWHSYQTGLHQSGKDTPIQLSFCLLHSESDLYCDLTTTVHPFPTFLTGFSWWILSWHLLLTGPRLTQKICNVYYVIRKSPWYIQWKKPRFRTVCKMCYLLC